METVTLLKDLLVPGCSFFLGTSLHKMRTKCEDFIPSSFFSKSLDADGSKPSCWFLRGQPGSVHGITFRYLISEPFNIKMGNIFHCN
jgi:hypothetical protein